MRTTSWIIALMSLTLAQLSFAGTPCRDYVLTDLDSGETVTGCASLSVESNKNQPPQLSPARQQRVRFGWKLSGLSRADLFSRMGLRPGDVLLKVNGIDMASQETPAKLGEILGTNAKLVIVIGQKPLSQAAAAPSPSAANTQIIQITKGARGLTLNTVEPGSYFANIGVQPGDTLLKIADQEVTDLASLQRLEQQAKGMDQVHVVILRQGQEMDMLIKSQ